MRKPHIAALSVLAVMVLGTALGALVAPPQGGTTVPRAQFAPPEPADSTADDGPASGIPRTAILAGHVSARWLPAAFRELGYDIERVRDAKAPVPRILIRKLPWDLAHMRDAERRKALFVQALLPLVLQVNEEILAERRRLWRLRVRQNLGARLDAGDRLWLLAMADKYRLGAPDTALLLERIDALPPSLALAQAAQESGWGTSRFVRRANAVFGEWTWSGSGIRPARRADGRTHRIRAFDSLLDSIRAYAHNLNSHAAYADLRVARARARRGGEALDSYALAGALGAYAERGAEYIEALRAIISRNDLMRLDDARLVDDDRPAAKDAAKDRAS